MCACNIFFITILSDGIGADKSMTLAELKQIIQDKYLHHAPPSTKCDCKSYTRWEPKLLGDQCQLCNHSFNDHNGYGPCTFVIEGGYTLSSGKKSDKYFDIKGLMCESDPCAYLYSALNEFLDNHWELRESFNCYGGVELGGIPIALMRLSGKNCCFIRKQQRIHGLKKMIEGVCKSPVLIVDDVISSGATIINAIDLLRAQKYTIAGILCVINRMNSEIFHRNNREEYRVYSLFREGDFQ